MKSRFSHTMKTIFIRGLAAILPSALTIVLVYWIFTGLEQTFKVPTQKIIGKYYFPGLGIIVALVVIFFVGAIINNWIIQKFYSLGGRILRKIPLIKTVYNSIYDVMQYFSKTGREKFGSVVMIKYNGWDILGFITKNDFEDGSYGDMKEKVAVYIPFSYQIGGFTYFIPKKELILLDIPVEQAMRFIITAGMIQNHVEKEEIK
jgi:uncharacterized membrane protein